MNNEKIVILGNGPSLKGFDLTILNNTPTLGMNAAYRHWAKINWYPTIYCCLDDQVVMSHHTQIKELIDGNKCCVFFLHLNILKKYPELSKKDNVYILSSFLKGKLHDEARENYDLNFYDSIYFKSNAPSKLTTGSYSVRFSAFLGFRKFELLGIDCDYVEIIKEAVAGEGLTLEITTTPPNNPNYFFDDYQIAGDVYNIPNPSVHNGNLHLQSFEVMKEDFKERANYIEITLGTKKSKLYSECTFNYKDINAFCNPKKLSAVFVPCTKKELPQIIRVIKMLDNPEEAVPYILQIKKPSIEFVLAVNSFKDAEFEKTIIESYLDTKYLKNCFSGLRFEYSNLEGSRDMYNKKRIGVPGDGGYMAGPNNQFWDIVLNFSKGMSCIFTMEVDCRVIRPGWLDEIENIISGSERFWIKGSHYRGIAKLKSITHINGCAIYAVGDDEFRQFLLNHIKPYYDKRVKENPHLAYDLILSDFFRNIYINQTSDKNWSLWQKTLPYFQYTDFIQNHSAEDDFYHWSGKTDVSYLRSDYPNAWVLHGMYFFPSDDPEQPTLYQSPERLYDYTKKDSIFIENEPKLAKEIGRPYYIQKMMSGYIKILPDSKIVFDIEKDESYIAFIFGKSGGFNEKDIVEFEFTISSDKSCNIIAKACRYGNDKYEANEIKITSENKEKRFKLGICLKAKHENMRLQLSLVPAKKMGGILKISLKNVTCNIVGIVEENYLNKIEPNKEFLLVSINPDLESDFGHYLHMDLKLREACLEINGEFLSLCSVNCKLGQDWLLPTFSSKTYESNAKSVFYRRSNAAWVNGFQKALITQFEKIIKDKKKGLPIIVYSYMTSPAMLSYLLEYAECFLNEKIYFVFNMSTMFIDSSWSSIGLKNNALADFFFEFIINSSKYRKSRNVLLTTDSFYFSDLIKKVTSEDWPLIPMFSISSVCNDPLSTLIKPKSKRYTVYYPSNSQIAKGFDLLEGLVNHAENDSSNEFDFVFRYFPRGNEIERLENIYKKLFDRVTFIDGDLSEQDYSDAILNADIILIPYRSSVFSYRTSAQVVDAFLLGKPSVVTNNTWAGDFVKHFGSGVTFEDGSASDFYRALKEVALNYEKISANCLEHRKKWLQENSNKTALNVILKPFMSDANIKPSNDHFNIADVLELFRSNESCSQENKINSNSKLLEVLNITTNGQVKPKIDITSDPNISDQASSTKVNLSSLSNTYSISPGDGFKSITNNQWQYKYFSEPRKPWFAIFDNIAPIIGREYSGSFLLSSTCNMTVFVALARHGSSEYEGERKQIQLISGVPQRIQLSKSFTKSHAAIRMQLDIEELLNAQATDIFIDNLIIIETLASIRARLGDKNITLSTANRLYREHDYMTALGLYLMLYQQHSLDFFKNNALRSAHKLGILSIQTDEDLFQLMTI
ncbi:MAG: hypothetical protein WCS87_08910 [Methylococcaceae bacterium]